MSLSLAIKRTVRFYSRSLWASNLVAIGYFLGMLSGGMKLSLRDGFIFLAAEAAFGMIMRWAGPSPTAPDPYRSFVTG